MRGGTVLWVAMLIGCASDTRVPDADGGERFDARRPPARGLELSATYAAERWEIGNARRGDGETFVEVEATVRNGTPEALPIAPPLFSIEFAGGLQIPGDPTTALLDRGCPSPATLAAGGELTCVVIFRVRSADAARIVLRTTSATAVAQEASAAVSVLRCSDCSGECTYLGRDPRHCGACGAAVGMGRCVDGAPVCEPGATLCGRRCVDTAIDAMNCGQCGRAIPIGGSCRAGQPSCPSNATECAGQCVDLQRDPANCGACGRRIDPNGECVGGNLRCLNGRLQCGERCVDAYDDAFNCGACGRACPNGLLCYGGERCYNEYSREFDVSCDTLCTRRSLMCTGGGYYTNGGHVPTDCRAIVARRGFCRCEYTF